MTTMQESAIEAATKRHEKLFILNIIILLFAAFLVAFVTWLTWNSGNNVQKAIQADADARIEAAKAETAQANERSKRLENDNLALRHDLNSEVGKLAELEKAAADAKAAQLRVETQLAEAKTRQAEAELRLEQFRKAQEARRLDLKAFRDALQNSPGCDVEILYLSGDNEAHDLAMQIFTGVIGGAWKPNNPSGALPRPISSNAARPEARQLSPSPLNAFPPILRITASRNGISVLAKKSPSEPQALQKSFANAIRAGGFSVTMGSVSDMPDGLITIVVGPKP